MSASSSEDESSFVPPVIEVSPLRVRDNLLAREGVVGEDVHIGSEAVVAEGGEL